MGEAAAQNATRLNPPLAGWVQDLPLREGPLSGKPDGQDELNHLDEAYLEFSMASDLPRGIMAVVSLVPIWMSTELVLSAVSDLSRGRATAWLFVDAALVLMQLLFVSFFLRFDIGLPRDRPVRFNHHRGKVYINHYTWNHNPFGKWGGGVKVWDWSTVQACITRRVGASGEVLTQRYDLLLVSCKPGTLEVVDTFRLQQGAMTTAQYEDLWALLRHYMAKGLDGLPRQNIRNPNPGFIDCLLFAVPWLAPTEEGRRARARMKGFWAAAMMVVMTMVLPLWLIFGIGNYIVMKIAPEAVWPPGMDEQSRA
jgi:hypothetical protein